MTRDDLDQIAQVVETKLAPIKTDIQELRGEVQGVKKDQEQILDTVSMIFQTVGEHRDNLTKRVETIEDMLLGDCLAFLGRVFHLRVLS